MKIVDADGNEVRLASKVRSSPAVSGDDRIFDNPEATAETIDADGWLHTGDVGYVDGANSVTITDRIRTCSSSAGSTHTRPRSRV
jgi:acyl-CoA synthetase (AMP-forming)/AMP-acid ligase II